MAAASVADPEVETRPDVDVSLELAPPCEIVNAPFFIPWMNRERACDSGLPATWRMVRGCGDASNACRRCHDQLAVVMPNWDFVWCRLCGEASDAKLATWRRI